MGQQPEWLLGPRTDGDEHIPIVVDGICEAAMELGGGGLLEPLPPGIAEIGADKSALQGILANREKVRDSGADPVHDAANSDGRQSSFAIENPIRRAAASMGMS